MYKKRCSVQARSGINAIVVTSRRLLGFSSRTLTWIKADRDLHEKVLERRILPHLQSGADGQASLWISWRERHLVQGGARRSRKSSPAA